MSNVNVKRVTKDKLDSEIEDKAVEGWVLQNRGDNLAIMKKAGSWGSGMGHLLFLVLTGWWSIGLGNLAYAMYSHYMKASELHIKVEEA